MKRVFLKMVIAALGLMPLAAKAERSATNHNFNAMNTAGTIAFTDLNRTGTTDLLTYTCSGPSGTEFGADNGVIAILLPSNGSKVITTRVPELYGMLMGLYPANQEPTNIKVYVSTNNADWTEVTDPDDYNKGSIDVSFPRNNYYVKIANTSSTARSIIKITYYTDHCNCFTYTP